MAEYKSSNLYNVTGITRQRRISLPNSRVSADKPEFKEPEWSKWHLFLVNTSILSGTDAGLD